MAKVTADLPVEKFDRVQDRQLYGKRVPVPSVVGYSVESAERMLTEAGLRLGEVSEGPSDEWAAGAVIATSPDPHSRVTPGSAINVTVSNGQDKRRDDDDDDHDHDDDDDDDDRGNRGNGRGNSNGDD